MSAAPQDNTPEPVPFFTDPRTLAQKLAVEKREWRAHQPEHNCPALISGLVLERDSYTDMNGELAPTLRLLTDDLETEWSVIAFHGWLKSGILKKDPQPGDYVALMFTGTRPTKKTGETPAFTYEVLVELNPDLPRAVNPTLEPAQDSDPEWGDGDAPPF
jgi:hypothetical protein